MQKNFPNENHSQFIISFLFPFEIVFTPPFLFFRHNGQFCVIFHYAPAFFFVNGEIKIAQAEVISGFEVRVASLRKD